MSNSPLPNTDANSGSRALPSFSGFRGGCLEPASFRIKLEIVNGMTEPLGEVMHPWGGTPGNVILRKGRGGLALGAGDLLHPPLFFYFSVALSGDQT